ncbi:EAL domain-containing response regulator [Vibrio brasiliensis]|uniref:Putative two-component response regulator n=1 Tax=Vibrio brasiliensis LMG 20546 TaxID=945543 RepID=E8LXZ5_9VIBR|nr:EAL domain-containing response regulator [Vibrio brasiliensis]EGA64368.1 putative two-component response regulator [Vibrio brasiliensis LMG 20546]MCG9725516.1 EAL domain-containing response regulator [Vibrio brasiliensis]
MNILILDDSPLELILLGYKLKNIGCNNVHSATTVEKAMSLVSKIEFDLVISDLDLPGKDGLMFLSELQKNHYNKAVCISSCVDEGIIALASKMATTLGLNVVGTLVKPVYEESLCNLMDLTSELLSSAPTQNKISFCLNEVLYGLDNDQFHNVYQPQVCFKTNKLIGFEVLVRWQHPIKGTLTPNYFIPTLEANRYTDLLLDTVINQLKLDFPFIPDDMRISINMTADNFMAPELVNKLVDLTDELEMDISLLTLEITESQIFQPSTTMLSNIARLRMLGVNISIDDFGTGYSSFGNLVDIPFTELKIDRQFTKRYFSDLKSRHIVDLTTELCRRTKIKVVAEGVETKEEFEALRVLGVDVCQGFYIGRPLAIEKLRSFKVLS